MEIGTGSASAAGKPNSPRPRSATSRPALYGIRVVAGVLPAQGEMASSRSGARWGSAAPGRSRRPACPGTWSGSRQRASSRGAPMLLSTLPVFRLTVLPTAGSRPSAGAGLARPASIVDLFPLFAVGVQPALDDLDAVEVGAHRVLVGQHQEFRSTFAHGEFATHGRRWRWPAGRAWRNRYRARRNRRPCKTAGGCAAGGGVHLLRCMAAMMDSRVLSSAQTAARPDADMVQPSGWGVFPVPLLGLRGRVGGELAPEIVLLGAGYRGVGVGGSR